MRKLFITNTDRETGGGELTHTYTHTALNSPQVEPILSTGSRSEAPENHDWIPPSFYH